MKKFKLLFGSILFMAALLVTIKVFPVTAAASQTNSEASVSIQLYDFESGNSGYVVTSFTSGSTYTGYINVNYNVKLGAESIKMTCSSSNTKAVKILSEDQTFAANHSYHGCLSMKYEVCAIGAATVTVKVGSVSETIDVISVPSQSVIKSLKQTGYNKVTVKWNKASGCSGYIIQRSVSEKNKYTTIKTVAGVGKTSATVEAEWNVAYDYRVLPYLEYHSHIVTVADSTFYSYLRIDTMSLTAEKAGAQITSVEKSGSSQLKLTWDKQEGAVSYAIYRADTVEGNYKRVALLKKSNTTSWKQKVTRGKQYFYYIVTTYPIGKSDPSAKVCGYIPKSGKAKTVSQSVNIPVKMGQYGGMWGSIDTTFYYPAGSKLYVVSRNGSKLNIFTVNEKTLKLKKYKTISLGKYESWGGFYQGTDGKFYVAVGFMNRKEKDSKTVIKVIQYSSNWKKGKVCQIKGGASTLGIYRPFEAGNCRMTMQGSTLYMETCRTMYADDDGLHHQSNIAFKINTKTMKYSIAPEVYCSHSFNQYVKFDNGNLYVVNHGDAYPRSVLLSIITDYGEKGQKITSKSVFKIKGTEGDNYTGLTVGGMEVGKDNVLICGTSVPQSKKVKGISGASTNLAKNVYLTISDKETGKTTFQWLTTYNPKKTKVNVGETRMVKLSDQYFAILYSTDQGKSQKLHYVVVDQSGKKVYSKTYSNRLFLGASQPILYNGNIVWLESYYDENYKEKVKTYSIPALY